MSEIDKALPNEVRKEINIPGVEEIQVELEKEAEQETKGPVEVQQNEDGSVDVNFDPSAVNVEGTEGHFANLAELLPDDVLDPLGSQMYENYHRLQSIKKRLGENLHIRIRTVRF
jgi:copper chaperone CopZ